MMSDSAHPTLDQHGNIVQQMEVPYEHRDHELDRGDSPIQTLKKYINEDMSVMSMSEMASVYRFIRTVVRSKLFKESEYFVTISKDRYDELVEKEFRLDGLDK